MFRDICTQGWCCLAWSAHRAHHGYLPWQDPADFPHAPEGGPLTADMFETETAPDVKNKTGCGVARRGAQRNPTWALASLGPRQVVAPRR